MSIPDTSAFPRLSKAPIAEALIDIRLTDQVTLDQNSQKALLDGRGDHFTAVRKRHLGGADLEIHEGQAVGFRSRPSSVDALLLYSQDEKEVVQFRVDGFAFSRLEPYTSWEEIVATALSQWRVYCEVLRPERLARVGVRYINRLPVPLGVRDPASLLVAPPGLPAGIPATMGRFASQMILQHKESPRLHCVVTQALVEDMRADTSDTLIVDVDGFRKGELKVSEIETLTESLNDLHSFTKTVFFSSITSNFLKEFE